MPVYNAQRYLAPAVDSILAQTFGDFEFLIVNDGSTDDSQAILERYAARDPRIRLVSRPNTGYTVALNQMLATARGEYVARMDADDMSLPRRLERQVEFLDAHPQVLALGAPATIIDPDGDPIGPYEVPPDHETIDARHLSGLSGMLIHPSAMMRREAVLAAGGYRPELEPAEDLDLWLRLAEIGRLANLDEVLVHYRVHLGNTTSTRAGLQRRVASAAVAEARRRRGLGPCQPIEPTARPVRSELQTIRAWAHQACDSGNYRTAAKHGWRVLRQRPLSPRSWRLIGKLGLGMMARRSDGALRRTDPASAPGAGPMQRATGVECNPN